MNYNNYSNKNKNRNKQNHEVPPVVTENATVEEAQCALRRGVVHKCLALNIRQAPRKDADVVTVIDVGTQVDIDPEQSTDAWYKATFVGDTLMEGYCMKQFIKVEE